MTLASEFRPDVGEAVDVRRDAFEAMSSCATCGSPEPVRLEGSTCSDCSIYPKCDVCDRWVGSGAGWLPGYVRTLNDAGKDIRCCTFCWKGAK